MRFLPTQTPACRVRRRIVAVLMTCAYVLTLAGVPLQLSAVSPGARPFPCQAHRCSCQSADSCWSHCCCFSLHERLAWARSQGIEAPVEELALGAHDEHEAAEQQHGSQQQVRLEQISHEQGGHQHCAEPNADDERVATEQHHEQSVGPRVMPTATAACCHKSVPRAPAPGWRAPKCHGVSTLWVLSGAVAPIEVPPAWAFDWIEIGRVSGANLHPVGIAFDPAVPPPRV